MTTIADIQRRRLENVLAKIEFSDGTEPTEDEINQKIGEYFSKYKFGAPLPMYFETFRSLGITNVDLMNKAMLHALYNTDVLYDAYYDIAEELFAVTTALNKRLEDLKARRAYIENKIDQALFFSGQTDGYFYAFSDQFSTLDNVDLALTTAFVDTQRKSITLPKLSSSSLSLNANVSLRPNSFKYEVISNNKITESGDLNQNHFGNVFDGLSDTYWSKSITMGSRNPVGLRLVMTFGPGVSFTNIFSRLLTVSALKTVVRVTVKGSPVDIVYTKEKTDAYDEFSLDLNAYDTSVSSGAALASKQISKVEILFVKDQPDSIDGDRFIYNFGVRDIIFSSPYFDTKAVFVSSPIILPSNNSLYFVDGVSLETLSEATKGSSLKYYVAEDVANPTSIRDFAWKPISPINQESSNQQTLVDFDGSISTSYNIKSKPTESNDVQYIGSEYSYNSIPTYRIAEISDKSDFIDPILTGGVSSFNVYRRFTNFLDLYNDITAWETYIANSDSTVLSGEKSEIKPGTLFWTSETSPRKQNIMLSCNVYCNSPQVVSSQFIKNDSISQEWNIGIFLNNESIATVPAGTALEPVTWNFKQGNNTINILIDIVQDSSLSGLVNSGSLTLFDDHNLNEFGTVYTNYYSYLDPLSFKTFSSNRKNTFTIDYVGQKRTILSTQKVPDNSRFTYLTKNNESVTGVRFMAELSRDFEDPSISPVIKSYKIKFKHGAKGGVDPILSQNQNQD